MVISCHRKVTEVIKMNKEKKIEALAEKIKKLSTGDVRYLEGAIDTILRLNPPEKKKSA